MENWSKTYSISFGLLKKENIEKTAADNVADRKTAPTGEAEFLLTFKP